MAQRVDAPPQRNRHPWDEWFDGEWWRLTIEDIPMRTTKHALRNFREYAYTIATQKRLKLETTMSEEQPDGEVLYMRATKRMSHGWG